jgi:branched-chain amino acid transport system ATP-binding protein
MSELSLSKVQVKRGEALIVEGINVSLSRGRVTVLLGPNGVGKTTLLEAISGVLPISAGTMQLEAQEIQRWPRQKRARAGIAHIQQGRVVFPGLSVEENLRAGAHGNPLAPAFELFPELEKRRHVAAGKLSGGEQQMVVLARAILGKPRFLLVDEMSLGLAPLVVKRLMPIVRALADQGVGVLLVEQFAKLALSVGNTALVMNQGRIVYSGPCNDLINDPALLQRAYLGE